MKKKGLIDFVIYVGLRVWVLILLVHIWLDFSEKVGCFLKNQDVPWLVVFEKVL